jgi:hypothetical protein
MKDQFSAAPSALGYLYQVEVALLEALRREDPALELSIEALDDIAFEGTQTELLQTKLQITPGSLTDGSGDLWRTLRIWSTLETSQPEALLVLVTTATAQEGSIAALLRSGSQRDPLLAHERLVVYARSTSAQTLAPARKAFLDLDDERRLSMVERIVIADEAPGLEDLDEALDRVLRHAAPPDRRPKLISRLREWWLLRAEGHLIELASGGHPRISVLEVDNRIADLRDQLSPGNLPIDLGDMPAPSDDDVAADQRTFVMQLRLIALANARIRYAVHDYNRAFAQRARWLREDLIAVGELTSYERRLKEEWERIWTPDTDEPFDLSDDEACERGRSVHRACDETMLEPLRPRVTEPYVMRGSLQMLADELKIGWHPEWVTRMQELLKGAPS